MHASSLALDALAVATFKLILHMRRDYRWTREKKRERGRDRRGRFVSDDERKLLLLAQSARSRVEPRDGLTLIQYLKHRFLQLHNRAAGYRGIEKQQQQRHVARSLSYSRPLDRSCPSSIRRNLQRATDRRPTTGRCISPHDAVAVARRRVDILSFFSFRFL